MQTDTNSTHRSILHCFPILSPRIHASRPCIDPGRERCVVVLGNHAAAVARKAVDSLLANQLEEER